MTTVSLDSPLTDSSSPSFCSDIGGSGQALVGRPALSHAKTDRKQPGRLSTRRRDDQKGKPAAFEETTHQRRTFRRIIRCGQERGRHCEQRRSSLSCAIAHDVGPDTEPRGALTLCHAFYVPSTGCLCARRRAANCRPVRVDAEERSSGPHSGPARGGPYRDPWPVRARLSRAEAAVANGATVCFIASRSYFIIRALD